MKFNKLYRFINDEIIDKNSEDSGLNPQNFCRKTDKADTNYFLYDLNLKKTNTFITHNNQKFQLNSQHVSIYEFQDDKNPFLSQYHYTAHFLNQDGKRFELHIYFNHNDQLTIEPIFSNKEDGAMHWDEKNHALSQNLTNLAINESLHFVTQLRKQQREHITNLEKHYVQLESALSTLSVDLIANQYKYVSLLKDTTQILEKLSYYNESKHYSSLVTLHERINRDMALLRNETLTTELEEPELSDQENMDPLPIDTHKNAIKTIKIPLNSLVQFAYKSKDAFLTAKKSASKTPIQVELFLQFHQNIYEALLLSDDTNYHVTVGDLQEIQKLICECTKEGKSLLGYLFVLKEYTLAESLNPYIHLVQDDVFSMALTVDNSELLELILKHGKIAINTFTVKDTLTPLLFCFEKSRNQCFTMLLKYGASLMVQAPDGLPLAHHILSNIHHPLVNVISASLSHDALIKLYQSVSTYVENYLAFQMPDTNQTSKLKFTLKQYHSHISLLKELKTPMSQHQFQKAQVQSSNIISHFVEGSAHNTQILKNVREDNTIQAKISEYNRLANFLLGKLSPAEKRRELKAPVHFENFDHLMKHGNFSTKTLKADIIDYLDQRIKLLGLKIELNTLQKNLSRINKKPKNLGNIIAREKELVREINELNKHLYPDPVKHQTTLKHQTAQSAFSVSLSHLSNELVKITKLCKTLQNSVNGVPDQHNFGSDEADLNPNQLDNPEVETINTHVFNIPLRNSANILSSLGLFCEGNNTAITQGVDVTDNNDDIKIDAVENDSSAKQP